MNTEIRYGVQQWELGNLEVIYERDEKAVWSAQSNRYGPVILKWDSSGRIRSEYQMLSRLRGRKSCCVYEYDEGRGLMLEERILPGIVLREVPCVENRVEIMAEVFREIHLPQQEGTTYLDWLEGACSFCQSHGVPTELSRMAMQARAICAELFNKYPDRALLHGDLHHDNLLRRADGSYAMIDPKGVVGPAILDLPRFLLNEADMDADQAHMNRTIGLVSRYCAYPEEDLRYALFMEAVLASIWNLEDGMPVRERWMKLALQTVFPVEFSQQRHGALFR